MSLLSQHQKQDVQNGSLYQNTFVTKPYIVGTKNINHFIYNISWKTAIKRDFGQVFHDFVFKEWRFQLFQPCIIR
jgi:hypothetical protein